KLNAVGSKIVVGTLQGFSTNIYDPKSKRATKNNSKNLLRFDRKRRNPNQFNIFLLHLLITTSSPQFNIMATTAATTAAASGAMLRKATFKGAAWSKLSSSSHISSFSSRSFTSSSLKFDKNNAKESSAIKAMSQTNNTHVSGLPINLKGKRAFIAGVADDNGYGWAIAKALAAAGAEILVGTWVPALNIFESSLRRGKFDELPDGSLMEITKVYPLDAVFDNLEDVPEDEVAESVKNDFGSIDILVHSLANGPEVTKPLLETSRNGYLAALSASSGSSLSLTYIASEKIIPGYGGGMSSAKAALESDTRVLAFEAGRKHRVRVNTISAGPLRSRAAKAIGFIDMMIDYSIANAPLQKELSADEVGNTAAFLASPLASAITGTVIYVDNGLHAMGVGVDSPIFKDLNIPKDENH
ncbi:hypothetical protein F8388_005299, partial [Cannabis sativa]